MGIYLKAQSYNYLRFWLSLLHGLIKMAE